MLQESISCHSAALIKATINMATVQWRLGQLDSAAENLEGARKMCAESEMELRAEVMHRFGSVLQSCGCGDNLYEHGNRREKSWKLPESSGIVP